MADNDEGTTTTEPQAQPSESTAPAAGTVTQPDEVTTLRSRNAGLDAKVTSLSQAHKDALARAEAAEARALALAEEKENGDQELRAELARIKAENAQARAEAAVARKGAQYPEAFAVFGDDIANMSDDKLAAAEARFKGIAGEAELPTPVGNNAARTAAPANKPIEEMTLAELKAHGSQAFNGLTWDAITE